MTKVLVLLVITFIVTHESIGQGRPLAGVVTENTAVGTVIGGYVGLNLTERWVAGAFYEDRFSRFESDLSENYYIAGGFLNYVIYREKKLDLSVMGRVGVKNNSFVMIVPSLVAGYRINRFLFANFFGTFRSEFPAVGVSVFTNFNFRKDEKSGG